MRTNKILVLNGGFNEEHEISLKTSNEVIKSLKKLKLHYKILTVNPSTFKREIINFPREYICFNALHGPFGEDGQIQKILKKNGFRVTHSNANSSSNCFDKHKSKKIIKKTKILTPEFKILNLINLNSDILKKFKTKFKKFVIKPINSGSSNGLAIIKTNKDLDEYCSQLTHYKKKHNKVKKILIEKYINGKELTVSVFKRKNKLEALDVTEIISFNKIYDYQAKYTSGFSKHHLPARISKKNYNTCLDYALKIHKLFKCNTLSRVDFIFEKSTNKIYFLEINSQPGMTYLSLLPEQAKFNKIKFEDLILSLINNSK
tara:strand:+ start:448 stop:1398 length:951 start_codon:yes stop_codon:yes gene_type:complete